MAVIETIDIGKRETVVEAIARGLIRYIGTHRLKGGDRLPTERELAEMVGASRLPLREALCMLKGLGIVEAKQGKGIFVKHLDMTTVFGMLSPLLKTQADIDVDHIFEARFHLEASIARVAATTRSDENLQALQAELDGMRENLFDKRAYVEHDMAFHQELGRSTGNPVFHVFMASITDLLCEIQFMYQDRVDYREKAIREHEQVLDAVRVGDGERAEAAMREHIRNAPGRI